MNVRVPTVVMAMLALARAASAADPCPKGVDAANGPLAGGTGPADFGAVPEACAATDAAVRLRGAALLAPAMPDYFGSLVGTTTLRGRYQLAERTSLSVAADLFTYRLVDNANLVSRGASFGPATVGFQQTFGLGATTAWALYARALIPVDTARQSGIETGAEIGAAIRLPVRSRFVVDGGLSLAAPLDVVAGQAHMRLEPGALAEGWLRLRPWVAVAGGIGLRATAAPTFDLVSVVPRVAVRFATRRRFWTALLVELPVAGSDRTDLIAGLFVGVER